MNHSAHLKELLVRRSDLKAAGQFKDAIPLQLEIIEQYEANGEDPKCLADAHNMASVLYLGAKLYPHAESHARLALSLRSAVTTKDHEARGAYNLVLARALASRFEYGEAAVFGEAAVTDFTQFHNPPDQFLSDIIAEVESMKNRTWVC